MSSLTRPTDGRGQDARCSDCIRTTPLNAYHRRVHGVGHPSVDERIAREVDYWRTSSTERPGIFPVAYLAQKLAEARVLLEGLERHRRLFENAQTILELGGGQGWASCVVKSVFGCEKMVTATDVSEDAVASAGRWEHVFEVKLDHVVVCPSFAIPVEDESFDLVFAFQAAHHFGAHRRTLAECNRILRAGGSLLYLHEPTASPRLYRLAVARANRKRAGFHRDDVEPGHELVEDVIVIPKLERIARDLGYETQVRFAPTLTNRGPIETIYYLMLSRLPFAQRHLPCTAELLFTKPSPAG